MVEKDVEKVSIYENFSYVKDAEFVKVFDAIKGNKFQKEIDDLRRKSNKGERDAEKRKLVAFTASASFNGKRDLQNVKEYNKIISLDFDAVPVNVEVNTNFVQQINGCPFTYVSFISPSGKGLKVFVKVDSSIESHEESFRQVANYYEELTGYEIDKCGKDVTRLCFVSADERAYCNQNSKVFTVVEQGERMTESFTSDNQTKTTEPLVGETSFQKLVDLTLRVLPFDESTRDEFINLLADNCNRRGIPINETISNILNSEYGYNKKEVISSVYRVYKNVPQHNSFPLKKADKNVASVAAVAQQATATSLRFRPFKQLAEEGKHLEPLKKLFGNYILEKSTTLFPSERGVGKSFLALEIAIKIAQGDEEFLGEALQVHGNVLYLNFELGEHTMKKRLEALMTDQRTDSEFQAYSFDQRGDFFGSISLIREFCRERKPVLIIVDNLRAGIVGMDNENNKVMSKVVTEINQLKDEFNCAFLLVHHTKKGTRNQLTNSDMQSGAGALTDLVDADFFLRKSGIDTNHRILKRVKARECEEQEGAKLITLNPTTRWFEFVEEGVDEAVHVLDEKSAAFKEKRDKRMLQLLKEGLSDAEVAGQLNVDRSTVFRAKKRLATN